jgi:hypothetical protein
LQTIEFLRQKLGSQMNWTTFIALVAAIGVGTIISAFVGLWGAISNHRQAWIDALRDDLATYFKELEQMHHVIDDLHSTPAKTTEKKKRDARVAILFVYWRIVMRLNRTEKMHVELRQKLDALMRISTKIPDREKIEDALDLARRILKREWEVTKWGPFAWAVIPLKDSGPCVEIHAAGTTRLTVCVCRWALKCPKGRKGREANRRERDAWLNATPTNKKILCPIILAAPFGLLVVMRRAVPLTEEEAAELRATRGLPEWDSVLGDPSPLEPKASDWGRIDGKLVALDYGAPEE